MADSRKAAEKVIDLLARYDSRISGLLQQEPYRRKELIERIETSLNTIAYGLAADIVDASSEGLEYLAEALSLGTGALPIEIAGALAERVVLKPLEDKYHDALDDKHPVLSNILRIYQLATEIPIIDTVGFIPEKTAFAVLSFLKDIYDIRKEIHAYMDEKKDYVKELYDGVGVDGYLSDHYGDSVHPARPVIPAYR